MLDLNTYPSDPYTNVVFDHHTSVPMDKWTWDNFRPNEFACKGTGKVMIDPNALDKLQILRNLLRRPISLNSAYRSPVHNRRVGGAKNSYHVLARAYDSPMDTHCPQEFETMARAAGFTGFGFYPPDKGGYNFIHIDTGPLREWGKRWSN